MPPVVLIVEDDPAIAELVAFHLRRGGFVPEAVSRVADARARLDRGAPEVVVLDLMLPDAGGLELCRDLAARAAVDRPAIIILTALAEEADRIAGLELGADDYVSKPFSPRELVARVRAVLRRRQPAREPDGPETPLRLGPLTLDRRRIEATLNGESLPLTATEYRLLTALAEAAGEVCTRDRLLDAVWGPDHFGDPRTVDVHIRHIREKLAAAGGADLLETVRGFGYRLRSEDRSR